MISHSLEVHPMDKGNIGILPPERKSIEELFAGDSRFTVPRYQRSFSWTADETEELWEDLSNAVERRGEYFLGTVVLHRQDEKTQAIIDGQQRLTCITMLFSAIRNIFRAARDERDVQIALTFLGSKDYSRGAVATAKLSLNKINSEIYSEYVVNSEDLSKVEAKLRDKSLHSSNRLLLDAYKLFLGKVYGEVTKRGTQADDFLVPLIDTLRNKLKLITIPVASDEDANLFFESLNARGKELAISDLVKNRLYLEAGNQVDRTERIWEQMEKDLARRPVPEFIRHYWIAKKTAKDGPNVREKHLYRMVATAIKGKRTEAIALARDLGKSAADYARIFDYSLWPDDSSYDVSFEQSLADLRLFRVTQANPLLLNAIQSFSRSKDIAKIFRVVANFAFRYFVIGNQSPGNLERVSANIAYEIRAKNFKTPQDIADALRAVNSDPAFRADFTLASMEAAKMARYTLAKISNYLAGQSGSEQIADPDAKNVNLEHVFPQDNPSSWRTDFSKGANPSDYIYRIGNLTLLRVKANRDAADKSFAEKKRLALSGSGLKINEFFKGALKWGDKEIELRQEGLAKAALAVWRL